MSSAIQKATERILASFQRGNPIELEIVAGEAVRRHPQHGFFHKALGVALMMQQKTGAIPALRRAAVMLPNDGEVFSNLGVVLHQAKDLASSKMAFLRALEITPNNPAFLTNYGKLLADLFDSEGAIAALNHAVSCAPDMAAAHFGRAYSMKQPWNLDKAIGSLKKAIELQPNFLQAWSNLLYRLNYKDGNMPRDMRDTALGYAAALRRALLPVGVLSRVSDFDPSRRLVIGLVSGDLRGHVVGRAVSAFLPWIDRNTFRLIAYSNQPDEDALGRRMREQFDLWRRVNDLSDRQLAMQVADDGVDILVDLAGHTAHNRLAAFVYRPAPLQISWLGYYATTGLEEIDYFVGDAVVMPPDEAAHFVEQPWRLPGPYYCGLLEATRTPVPLPALSNGFITFGCCNNLIKLSDPVIETWSALLRQMPTARLLIKTRELADASACAILSDKLRALGVAAGQFELEGESPRDEYFAWLNRIDIALDPFPFPGGATTLDCLSLGIPVLTLRGDRFIGHQGETLLAGLGLEAWIAENREDYVRRAVTLAADLPALADLRTALGQRIVDAPVFDGQRLGCAIGAAWRAMWQERCQRA